MSLGFYCALIIMWFGVIAVVVWRAAGERR
jgi:hypothetical protein